VGDRSPRGIRVRKLPGTKGVPESISRHYQSQEALKTLAPGVPSETKLDKGTIREIIRSKGHGPSHRSSGTKLELDPYHRQLESEVHRNQYK
jgi:hypothetical protein